jgi:dihydrofolate synthase/folylpolyglutamate synthase
VITGAVQHEALAVIEREAWANGSSVYRLSRDFMPTNIAAGFNPRFDYRGIKTSYDALEIGMVGRYQVDNACLALAALECLCHSGVTVDEPALRRGLGQARWEGRMERVARRPDIYLDGAHNPASAEKLAASVREMMQGYRRLVLVIGILGDKDIRGILGPLVPLAASVVATRPQYSRALDVQTLAAEVRKLHGSVLAAETLVDAIGMAKQGASADDLILVTGSLYVVGDARARFAPQDDMTVALRGLKG